MEPRAEEFSDVEIKAVLDNCRLDYVYEPDWTEARVADVWAAGEREDRGVVSERPRRRPPAVSAERVVLSDPTARFVRDNINGFLLGRAARFAASRGGVDDATRMPL